MFFCDWKCRKCGAVSENVSTDIKDQWCPYCGIEMNRIYTPPLVMFKGDGFTPKFHSGDKEK